jgi:hypothetical protein
MAMLNHPRLKLSGKSLSFFVIILLLFSAPAVSVAQQVRFFDLNVYSSYSGAIAPNSLQMACAPRQDLLVEHFSHRRLRFDPQVLRRVENQTCHIMYEPTLPGFRAHSESDEIRGVFADIPHMRLLAMPGAPLGDSLDIVKAVLSQAPEPMDLNLGVAQSVPLELVYKAVTGHFTGTKHRIQLRMNPATHVNSWSQDFIQSGETRRGARLLAPRRIFEGDRENGETFRALLDGLPAKVTTRSRLSWEGGDLLFVKDPRHPERLILFYGDAARPYWADKLTEEEYAYVLELEFGADQAIYLGSVAPHVDYVVSFMPEEGVALLGEPVTGNLELARAALQVLTMTFRSPRPPVLQELTDALAGPDALTQQAGLIKRLIERARRESGAWEMPVDAATYGRIEGHIAQHCPKDALGCVGPAKLPALMREQPELLRDWVQMAAVIRSAQALPGAMLSIIEDQLPGETNEKAKRLQEHARTLERLGFRVIRLPWLGGELHGPEPWAGVSYANMVKLENRLFIPVFGLGPVEQRLVEGIEPRLPAGYRVMPVFARSALLQNGGVHCVLGTVRGDGLF